MRYAVRGIGLLGVVGLVGACNVLFPTRPPAKVEAPSVKCGAVRPSATPDLVAWDAESRAQLSKARKGGGAVVVRYHSEGCNVELEVLANCHIAGQYEYAAHTGQETKIVRNPEELYAGLPLGAANLGGHLRGDVAVRVDTSSVGIASLPIRDIVRTSELSGPDCERATHVVSQVHLGGFTVVEGRASVLEEDVTNPFAPKAKALPKAARVVFKGAAPQDCAKVASEGKDSPECAEPLKVGLLAIEGRAATGCPDGSSPDGATCVQRAPLTQSGCAPGTKLEADKCVGALASACAAGTRYEGGFCVPKVAASAVAEAPDAGPVEAGPPAPEGMVLIPAGTLSMGSNDGEQNEKPVHPVKIAAFWMDVTEVTVEAYADCIRAGACSGFAVDPQCNSGRQAGRLKHPVNCVTATEAEEYCHWAKKRLPTEAEWEYGARGSDTRRYPWGDAAPGVQACWNGEGNNVGRGSRKSTCVVGSFPTGRSPFGLLDMAGNVMEWTSSPHSDDYSRDPVDGTRSVRGGSWEHGNPNSLRSAIRIRSGVESRVRHLVGFRCAQTLP